MELKSFEFVFTENEVSYFECYLPDCRFFIIEFWSFYEFISNTDENLKNFALKFDEWEELTRELIELEYDFMSGLTAYINQFNEEELEDFCFHPDDEN